VHEEEPKTMEEICAALEAKGLIEPARNADGSIQQRPDRFGRLQTVWVSSDWGREVDALRGAALDRSPLTRRSSFGRSRSDPTA